MSIVHNMHGPSKADPQAIVDFLRTVVKRSVLWCYVHRALSIGATQRIIDALKLNEA